MIMANQVTGKIEVLGQTQQIASKNGGSTFTRRELVLTVYTFDKYTGELVSGDNHPQFEFGGDKCSKLDAFKVGQFVTVSFALQGGWYEKDGVRKNFTRVVGYDIQPYGKQAKTEMQTEQQTVTTQSPVVDNMPPTPPIDKLPF